MPIQACGDSPLQGNNERRPDEQADTGNPPARPAALSTFGRGDMPTSQLSSAM